MYNLFEDSQVLLFGNGCGLKSLVLRVTDSDSGSNIDSSEDEDGVSAITHRVVFKCIGCTKEHITTKLSLLK